MKNKTLKMVILSIFAAIIAVISFLPIRTLGLEITLSMVPVAVGAICLGSTAGAILGGVFGLVSFLQCITGFSPFGAALLSINPLYAFFVCVPTRVLAGWLCGVVFKAINKIDKTKQISYISASLSAPILNTVFFMSALVLCFYNTDLVQGLVAQLGAANPFMFIVLFIWINSMAEIIAGFILAYPASKAVTKAIARINA